MAIGNPIYWVCDTAGSPGTWRAIYTIETYSTYDRIPKDTLINGKLAVGNTSFSDGVIIKAGGSLTGAGTSIGFYQKSIVQNDVVSADGFRSELQTAASSFTLSEYVHFLAYQNVIGSGSTVTTQVGFAALSNMIGATNNRGFSGAIPSGSNNWNLYMSGTASNYLNGTTLIGKTSDSGLAKFQVLGSIQQSSVTSSLLKTDTNGVLIAAIAGTDYVEPSGLGSYVPYTGATSDVDLDTHILNAQAIHIKGTASNGHLGLKHQSATPIGSANESLIFADVNGNLGWQNSNLYLTTFNTNTNTNNRIYTFPNASGTIALTSDIPSLTGYVTGTGTTNTLPKFTGTSSIGNSNITDTGSLITLSSITYITGALGIGTNTNGTQSLRVTKTITGATTAYGIFNNGTVQSDVTATVYNNISQINTAATSFTLGNYYHYGATQGTIGSGSTVTTQIGFYASSGLTGATNNYGFRGDLVAATGVWNFYAAGTANNYLAGNLGIGSSSLTGYVLRLANNITGATTSYAVRNTGVVQSDVTSSAFGYSNTSQTAAAAFTLGSYFHYAAYQSTIGAGSAITNQYGYYVDSTMSGATNNFGFRSDIAAATGAWNFYAAGTANNYMAGNLAIGSSSVTSSFLNIAAGTTAKAQINLASSTAPTSPVNGDIWFDGTNLKIRVAGVTKTFTIV